MRWTVRETMFEGIVTLIFIWILTGCASQPRQSTPIIPPMIEIESESKPAVKSKIPVLKKPAQSEQKHKFYVHKVRCTGETLSVIAQWYTGDQNNSKHIVKANSSLDPKRIRIGYKILIPAALLKTREPMPKKYLENTVRKKNAPTSPFGKPSIESDKVKVVGATEINLQATKVNEIELFHPKSTKRPTEELGEIELFQPQDIGQAVAEPREVELFQPVE